MAATVWTKKYRQTCCGEHCKGSLVLVICGFTIQSRYVQRKSAGSSAGRKKKLEGQTACQQKNTFSQCFPLENVKMTLRIGLVNLYPITGNYKRRIIPPYQ